MHKSQILVCYDYGMGGVWGVIEANDANDVIAKYPWLTVFARRPSWMSDEQYADIAATSTFDIDQPASGWLLAAARERQTDR